MVFYMVAAVILILAMLLLSLAMRHKTLLNPEVEREMVERLEKLAPASTRQWGVMSPAQMLRHLTGALQMATGDLIIPLRQSPLRRFPLKQLIIFVLPFPKSAPTAPALIPKGDVDFEAERATVRDLLTSFARRQIAAWPDHPAFGPMTREQWGVMAWKHVDHHFGQFGV